MKNNSKIEDGRPIYKGLENSFGLNELSLQCNKY